MQKVVWIALSVVLLSTTYSSYANQNSHKKPKTKETELISCLLSEGASLRKEEVERGLRNSVRFINKIEPGFHISDSMQKHKTPAISATLIKNNRIDWSDGYGALKTNSDQSINCRTLFQAASLSKPVFMMAMMRMHQEDKINLDKNIHDYLKSFKLPEGKQSDENPVTLRNILNHTSGITPGGFMGYTKNEVMPTDLEVLTATGNTNSPAIEVINTPGEQLMYSGGAYTLAELTIQDIFNRSFEDIMYEWLLEPIQMHSADFSQPLTKSKHAYVARGHKVDGLTVEGGWHNHPEQAAAGLWINSMDLAKFLIEIGKALGGKVMFSQSL